MRKMVVEAKRRISLLLAAAMLAGSIPQDVLAVSAAEAYTEATFLQQYLGTAGEAAQ